MKHRLNPQKLRLPQRLPTIKKPGLPRAVRHRLERRKIAANPLEALSDLPRITNETVAEHREEIIGSARKYIYPLQHSRGRIIKISATLFVLAIVGFFAYCGLALYKFQTNSTFIYEVTRVIPFPVAKAGSYYVSYESYLFELRHLTHYYQTQQKENFSGQSGALHLAKLKQDSLQKVIGDAYVKQLATQNHVVVSDREVNDEITLVKSQNRLGSNDQMLTDVLKQFWGWSINDFSQELKSQLLSQKVASALDTATHARANNALAEINSGTSFATVASQFSDDASTKGNGGQYPAAVAVTNREIPPTVISALFKLQPGQTSGIVDAGYTLEIVNNISVNADKVTGAHVSFKLQPISVYVQPLEHAQTIHKFIKV